MQKFRVRFMYAKTDERTCWEGKALNELLALALALQWLNSSEDRMVGWISGAPFRIEIGIA